MRDASHIEEVLNTLRTAWYNNPDRSIMGLLSDAIWGWAPDNASYVSYAYTDENVVEALTDYLNKHNKGPMKGASLTNMRITTK